MTKKCTVHFVVKRNFRKKYGSRSKFFLGKAPRIFVRISMKTFNHFFNYDSSFPFVSDTDNKDTKEITDAIANHFRYSDSTCTYSFCTRTPTKNHSRQLLFSPSRQTFSTSKLRRFWTAFIQSKETEPQAKIQIRLKSDAKVSEKCNYYTTMKLI